ncbi:MAG: hypothetical protein ACLRHW_01710 [Coprobacillus cateniformis]
MLKKQLISRENDVLIKVISGDNPVTVSALAAQVGVENSSIIWMQQHYKQMKILKMLL